MGAGFVVLMFIIAAFSIALGFVLGVSIKKNGSPTSTTQGIVYVDRCDPDGRPWLYLEATATIDDIASRKQVTFDVNVVK